MTSPMRRGLFEPAALMDLRPSKKSFFFIMIKKIWRSDPCFATTTEGQEQQRTALSNGERVAFSVIDFPFFDYTFQERIKRKVETP